MMPSQFQTKEESNAMNADELWVKQPLTTLHVCQEETDSLGPISLVSLGCVSARKIYIFIMNTCFNLF